jgi:hypothetical protein
MLAQADHRGGPRHQQWNEQRFVQRRRGDRCQLHVRDEHANGQGCGPRALAADPGSDVDAHPGDHRDEQPLHEHDAEHAFAEDRVHSGQEVGIEHLVVVGTVDAAQEQTVQLNVAGVVLVGERIVAAAEQKEPVQPRLRKHQRVHDCDDAEPGKRELAIREGRTIRGASAEHR